MTERHDRGSDSVDVGMIVDAVFVDAVVVVDARCLE